jgi:uncharacterized membrane protein YagU involved in acid resistance
MEKLVDHKKKQSNLPREATESLGLPNTPNDSYESLYLKAQLQAFQKNKLSLSRLANHSAIFGFVAFVLAIAGIVGPDGALRTLFIEFNFLMALFGAISWVTSLTIIKVDFNQLQQKVNETNCQINRNQAATNKNYGRY